MSTNILSAKSLSRSFLKSTERGVFDVSLSLEKGEVVCILGPSGAGKSTLLRLLAGLEDTDTGTVEYDHAHTLPGEVVYVPQEYTLWPHLTVLENLTLAPREVRGVLEPDLIHEARDFLQRFGLAEYAGNYAHELSGGQKQRVALIRALMMHPGVLLLDEVTSALDPELTKSVLDMIRTLAKDGYTMVVVTHHVSLAVSIANRIIFMDKGKILRDAPAQKFFHQQTDNRILSFLESANYKDPTVEVFKGIDQFQAFQLGTIKRSKSGSVKNVVGSSGDRWFECMGEYYEQYEKERLEKSIGWKMLLYDESPLDRDIRLRYPKLNKYRLLPKNVENPANYYVLEDSVVIQIFGKPGDEPTIIEIRNPNVAQSYQNYFNLLWEQSNPVT